MSVNKDSSFKDTTKSHCDDYECPKNAGGVCHAPNPCLGYEETGKVLAELEAAKRELAKFRAGGNAAATREALSDACYAMFNFLKSQTGGYEEMANALDKAKAALAAPPRNCDLPNPEERYSEFCSRYQSCSCCPHNMTLNELRCDGEWLLAPATEQEGDTDGDK